MPHTKSHSLRQANSCALCATRSLCLVSHVAARDLPRLEPLIRKKSVPRGYVLGNEGEVANAVNVMKMGSAVGYRRGIDGVSRPIVIQGRGTAFGIFSVLGQRTQVTNLAASAARVCEIPAEALREIAGADPELWNYVATTATENCGRLAVWSEATRLRGVANQLAYTLLLLSQAQGLPVIELPTHSALAELLGTTRETIVRCLGTLEAEGGIKRGERKWCEVHREPLLARMRKPGAPG